MAQPAPPKRKQLYAVILSKLRQLMVCRMAKPEEVRGLVFPKVSATGQHTDQYMPPSNDKTAGSDGWFKMLPKLCCLHAHLV